MSSLRTLDRSRTELREDSDGILRIIKNLFLGLKSKTFTEVFNTSDRTDTVDRCCSVSRVTVPMGVYGRTDSGTRLPSV